MTVSHSDFGTRSTVSEVIAVDCKRHHGLGRIAASAAIPQVTRLVISPSVRVDPASDPALPGVLSVPTGQVGAG